jgi:hypothetical protein
VIVGGLPPATICRRAVELTEERPESAPPPPIQPLTGARDDGAANSRRSFVVSAAARLKAADATAPHA